MQYGKKAFAWVLLLPGVCFAQQVTVRVVASGDGQPLPAWKVDVYFVNPTQGKNAVQGAYHTQTDTNGMAQFALPNPSPQVLNVYAFPPTQEWYPSVVKSDPAVVLQQGTHSEGKMHGKMTEAPGQVLIIGKRVTLWDKIIHAILDPVERE
jgi:hypothetical protein